MQLREESEKLNDYWLRIIGIPMVSLAATCTFSANVWIKDHSLFWKTFIVSAVTAVLTWESCRVVLLYVRKKFPSLEQTGKRIFFSYLFYFLDCAAVTTLIFLWYKSVNFWGYKVGWQDWLKNLVTCYSFISLIALVYEVVYYYRMWRHEIVEMEELKKTSMQYQLDMLKNQINPHFLFNSLNVLSSLVEEDFDHADKYVNELSHVYDYVLESNKPQLIKLSKELEFINAYFFLLRTRFGDNLKIYLNIKDEFITRLIPPLTLQLLVENAVKHNVVSKSKPLHIRIETNGHETLSVSNNLQKKTKLVMSNNVGLKNIKARFSILARKTVIVNETAESFTVTIPLIKFHEIAPYHMSFQNVKANAKV